MLLYQQFHIYIATPTPTLPLSFSTQINLLITVIVIYWTRACFHFHVMFDDSIVYNSCTRIFVV